MQLLALRGNTGAGKTRVTGRTPGGDSGLVVVDRVPYLVSDADNFVDPLLRSHPGVVLAPRQVVTEASMLADRMLVTALPMTDANNIPIPLLVERTLPTVESVATLARQAHATGREFSLHDVDAPLALSVLGVLMRNRSTESVPTFEEIGGGFHEARERRSDIIKLFQHDSGFGHYRLTGTRPDGTKVATATVQGTELQIADQALFSEATTVPTHPDDLGASILDAASAEAVTANLPADFANAAQAAVAPYLGMSWRDAVNSHGAVEPTSSS